MKVYIVLYFLCAFQTIKVFCSIDSYFNVKKTQNANYKYPSNNEALSHHKDENDIFGKRFSKIITKDSSKTSYNRLKRDILASNGKSETFHIGRVPKISRKYPNHRHVRAIDNSGPTINHISIGKGMKVRNDTFGKNAYMNVITGLYLSHFLSKLPNNDNYNIYHHYNRPENQSDEVYIKASEVVMCQRSASDICIHGSRRICVGNGTVYCGISNYGVPVGNESVVDCSSDSQKQECAKIQTTCSGDADPLCTEDLEVPCLTKLQVDMINVLEVDISINYCIVSYSVPKPQYNRPSSRVYNSNQRTNNNGMYPNYPYRYY